MSPFQQACATIGFRQGSECNCIWLPEAQACGLHHALLPGRAGLDFQAGQGVHQQADVPSAHLQRKGHRGVRLEGLKGLGLGLGFRV